MSVIPPSSQPKAATPGPVSLEYARAQLMEQARHSVLPVINLPLTEALGHVQREELCSSIAVPAFRNSAMDGYAYCAADVRAAGDVLPVRQRIAAGDALQRFERMTLARIFTGAPVPEGADTVVPQEDTSAVNDCEGGVRLDRLPPAGSHIRHIGEDIAQGAVVLQAGTRLGAAQLGLAASVGVARLQVARKPRVALLNTGDELVQPGTLAPSDLPSGAVFNSSQFFLEALLTRFGAEVGHCGGLADDAVLTRNSLQQLAQTHDVILTSGGVSVGEEDHVGAALKELGHTTLWKIAMKPGKPFLCGLIARADGSYCHVLGLPGNPVSSFVTCVLLVRPFLLALQGAADAECAWPVRNVAAAFAAPADKRRNFMRVRLVQDEAGHSALQAYASQSSGVLTSVAWASGLADIAPGLDIQPGILLPYWDFAYVV